MIIKWFDPNLERFPERTRYCRWRRRISGKMVLRSGNYSITYEPLPIFGSLGFYRQTRMVYHD